MAGRRLLWAALVALPLAAVGFAAGAAGSAWHARETRADPWRSMRVEQRGTEGVTTTTRVVFENPKLALQAVEVIRSPEGSPELARIVLRDGAELTARWDGGARPTSLEASDGTRATIAWGTNTARVDFAARDRKELGSRTLTIPVELRSSLQEPRGEQKHGSLLEEWLGSLVPEARAQDAAEPVTVVRHVEVGLDVRVPAGTKDGAGRAQIEASCAPLSCVPVTPDVAVPGRSTVRVAVTGSAKRGDLKRPADASALGPFEQKATAERRLAARVLPDVSTVIATVGVTASACKWVGLTSPLCVAELGKGAAAAAPIHAIAAYEVPTKGRVVDQRAAELFDIEQARALLDREMRVQVCVTRQGFARPCTELAGRPFGVEPMPRTERSVELRPGIGGELAGSFVMTQQDGPDCRFSPSPETSGAMRLGFDNATSTLSASMRADRRGVRPDLRCSLGTTNMSWSQTYTVTAKQTFTPQQLEAGGKLPLRLTGTMNGVGTYNFSNCRASGGAAAGCPAGKSEGYDYPVEIVGELDLGTQIGSGNIVVQKAPLATSGTWRVPAAKAP